VKTVTRPLSAFSDVAVDLNDVAGSDGHLFVRNAVGLAGRGIAARVPIDDAAEFLASLPHDTTVDAGGPVALGSLGFRPGSAATLIVPEIVVRKFPDGQTAVTTFGEIDDDAVRAALAPRPPAPATASSYRIEPAADIQQYLDAVVAARDAVRSGELTKAVIARPIHVTSSSPIDVHAVLQRLRASFGSSYRFSIEGFIASACRHGAAHR